MTNIAQTINVLQAMILTDGSEMLLTPTYHVYDMYKVHQDARLLDFALLCDDYTYNGQSLKQINASVSKNHDGQINITLVNIAPDQNANITCHIPELSSLSVSNALILTAPKMNAMNTFEQPDSIAPKKFTDFLLSSETLNINMPAKSVVLLTIPS